MSTVDRGPDVWNQRDQLQAYHFLRRRIISALQSGDANNPTPPNKRAWAGTAVGIGCAFLVAAAFAIYGVLRPGSGEDWRRANQIVLERESGAAFVLGDGGLLHPVLNFTSARLLAGTGSSTVTLPARALADAPRGAPLGIAGAPESLPSRERLTGAPWTVCVAAPGPSSGASRPAGSAATAREEPVTTLVVADLTGGDPLAAGSTVVVRDATGRRYAVADGRRFRIAGRAAAVALGLDRTAPLPVSRAWLAALAAGPDLAVIGTEGSGRRGPRVGPVTTRIGQVLVTGTLNGDRHYQVSADGLVPVSAVEAALLLAGPTAREAYGDTAPRAVPVSAADIADAPTSTTPRRGGFPAGALTPVPASPDRGALCATTAAEGTAEIRVAVPDPRAAGAQAVPTDSADGVRVDRVHLPPGSGVLAVEHARGGAGSGTAYLVSDLGVRYRLDGRDAVEALGFGGIEPAAVPAAALDLLPTGPRLSRADAHRERATADEEATTVDGTTVDGQ